MRPINVEILMGHNIGVSASYYEPKEHEVLEDYLRASDHLTIGGDKKILEKQIYELTEKQDETTYLLQWTEYKYVTIIKKRVLVGVIEVFTGYEYFRTSFCKMVKRVIFRFGVNLLCL